MKFTALKDLPPWGWPEDAGATLLGVLRNRGAADEDRLLAAELAGDLVVMDDDLAQALVAVLRDHEAATPLRARAAISLGPVLEEADLDGFDAENNVPISEETFRDIQASLRAVHDDNGAPRVVRRRALEASVRAPQEWHQGAIRAAHASSDADWQLTAVFCMRFVRGFESEIAAALSSADPDILYEAVEAAGAQSVAAAWPQLVSLLKSPETEKPLLLAAIEAVAGIRPDEAPEVLDHLLDSEDEEIADAVAEALTMAEADTEDDGEDYDDDDLELDDDEEADEDTGDSSHRV